MNRRAFLLAAGGVGLLSPRVGQLREALDQPALRPGSDRIARAICRGAEASPANASAQIAQTALPGADIPKYVDGLTVFTGRRISAANIDVSLAEFQQQILPAAMYSGLPAPFDGGTFCWGYKVGDAPIHFSGYTIEAQSGTPTTVTYSDNLPTAPFLQKYLTVDQTLHWADPLSEMGSVDPYVGPPPVVTHLHGAEVPSAFDGAPDAWFTPGLDPDKGKGFVTNIYNYPNRQQATTLWFHDHVLGMTRLNIYAGLAAFYLLRDSYDTGLANTGLNLPAGPYEVELCVQDRQFDINGQWLFPAGNPAGLNGTPPNPEIHPFWLPEFFGDAIVVNGKTWPYLDVEPRRYRFRLLNGCNARVLELKLTDPLSKRPGPALSQIGTDGGLLDQPVALNDPAGPNPRKLLLPPAARADLIIDFAGLEGQTLVLRNSAAAPYPSGDAPDPETNGQIMQFRVTKLLQASDSSFDPARNRARLRGGRDRPPAIVRLALPELGAIAPGVTISKRRQLILNEVEGDGGPIESLLNNTRWDGQRENTGTPIPGFKPDGRGNWLSELPRVGSTELWEIINLTGDAHPIHLHLVQFQLLNRQRIYAD
jgi:FtsP/CotA-like multicopper oxidase with cupredoxin domain